ncbi:uncharacterized protein [Anabrus simplex]|uniref:uncharacterized protein n=1 Tax=Anabrus simplex TaxID=316456 RepID=UPI0035A293E6
MLKQVLSKVDHSATFQSNPLHNLLSYNVKEKEFCEDDLKENYVSKYPPNYDIVDYRTSMQRDYRPIHLYPKKPVSKVAQPREKNILCLSELNDAGSMKRRGINKFLDDGLEDFYTNKHLRWDRYSSYDPTTVPPLSSAAES